MSSSRYFRIIPASFGHCYCPWQTFLVTPSSRVILFLKMHLCCELFAYLAFTFSISRKKLKCNTCYDRQPPYQLWLVPPRICFWPQVLGHLCLSPLHLLHEEVRGRKGAARVGGGARGGDRGGGLPAREPTDAAVPLEPVWASAHLRGCKNHWNHLRWLHLPLQHHPNPRHHAILHGPWKQDNGAVRPLCHCGGHLHGMVHDGVHHTCHLLPKQDIFCQERDELDWFIRWALGVINVPFYSAVSTVYENLWKPSYCLCTATVSESKCKCNVASLNSKWTLFLCCHETPYLSLYFSP